MSLASKLPWTHRFAGGYPGLSSQPLPTDADAIDYLSRMATADGAGVETGVAVAVDAFVRDSKALGVWDSIRASCVLAGARTLAGALVPLRDYGPELWGTASPGSVLITDNGSGVATTWDAATLTFTCDDTYTTSYPRISIPISGIEAGKQYRLSGRFSGDPASIVWITVDNSGSSTVSVNASTGEFNGTSTAAGVVPYVTIAINGSTGPLSITIESISIREVIAAPTNVADGFCCGDYSRTAGLTGDGATTYLDSGRASDDDPQNDSHWSVYPTALGTPAKALIHTDYIAANEDVSGFVFNQAPNTSVIRSRIGSLTGTPQLLAATYEPTNLIAASRASGTEFTRRYNGISEPVTASSATPQALNYFVFARQNGAGVELVSDATIAFYSIGNSLGTDPAVGLADLDTAVTNLINRLKFALLVGENPSGLDPDAIDYIVRGYEAGGSLE